MSNSRFFSRAALGLIAVSFLWSAIAKCADKPKPDGKRYVIIHGDDAGMSHTVNRGTIEAMRDGIVSSTSIMVPCPWLPEFAEHARKNPDDDYGIHLCLNSEFGGYRWGPVAPREKVPSLLDKDGYLHHGSAEVAANAKTAEVEIELRAQIERAKQFGIPLSHLDTHMGTLLMRPDFVEVYVNLGIEYDLPVLFIRKIPPAIKRAYPGLARDNADKLIKVLDEKKLPVLDRIYQFYSGDDHDRRKALYLSTLRNLEPGVTEIIIHCGYDDAELQAITSSHFIRDSDRRVFSDPEVIAEVKKIGVEVITWKQFHAMAKGAKAD
ncbi:MAG: polysaccharide deacetylase family protein [Planctomycetaceae bacterium]